jgi:hypothetical protein
MKHYIEELKRQLHEIMELPATLGRAEEITVYADAICALRRMEGHDEADGFTEEDAKAWTAKMENEDGTTGPHWSMSQTDAVANITGVNVKPCIWHTAMNMMYSDYYGVAAKYGLDRPEFYADLAKAFLMDKDAGGPEEKMAGYYHGIVLRGK